MQSDIYRKLQERLDQLSYGFPKTESGVELKLLRHLYSEKDAELFLLLGDQPELAEDIARRSDRDPNILGTHLEDMAERGLLLRFKTDKESLFAAAPFVAGIFEFQLGTMDREFAELYEQYNEEAFHQATVENVGNFIRPVPVNKTVDTTCHVASYDDARKLLKNAKSIVAAECICRKQQAMIDQGCDKPKETCLLFDDFGQIYLDLNMARKVSAEEAIQILDQVHEAGLVTQAGSAQNPAGMCNCCACCCQSLKPLNRLSKPAEMVSSNYFAMVDSSLCSGCETCLDRCQMSAIDMNEEELAVINLDRCIGCGLCASTCPTEAVRLILKPEEKRKVPSVTVIDQMALLAKNRGY